MSSTGKFNPVIRSSPVLARIPSQAESIPNIDLGKIYDPRFATDDIQYGNLDILANLLGRNPKPHRHNEFLQIHFIASGSFELRIDEQAWQGKGPALFLTPPAVPHTFALQKKAKGHVLTLRQSLVWRILDQDRSLLGHSGLAAFCVAFSGPEGHRQAAHIASFFNILQHEMANAQKGTELVCEGLVRVLLGIALRAGGASVTATGNPMRDLGYYRQYLELVERHFQEHWPLKRFAKALGLTEWRLHEVTTTCGNAAAGAIVNNRLVQEAKRLLTFSNASIKEISAQLGFTASPYFCRFFKQHAGMTPSQCRIGIVGNPAAHKSAT